MSFEFNLDEFVQERFGLIPFIGEHITFGQSAECSCGPVVGSAMLVGDNVLSAVPTDLAGPYKILPLFRLGELKRCQSFHDFGVEVLLLFRVSAKSAGDAVGIFLQQGIDCLCLLRIPGQRR